MTLIAISIALILISAICKAIQDKLQFHFSESVFRKLGNWWNPKESWRNKWKHGIKSEGERFPGSSTVFVSLTDAWHFFGLIRNFSSALAVGLLSGYWWFVFPLYIVWTIVFHLLFTYGFKHKP